MVSCLRVVPLWISWWGFFACKSPSFCVLFSIVSVTLCLFVWLLFPGICSYLYPVLQPFPPLTRGGGGVNKQVRFGRVLSLVGTQLGNAIPKLWRLWVSMGCRASEASPCSSPCTAGESLDCLLPLLLHWPWWLQGWSYHPVSLLSSGCNCTMLFFSFLKHIIPKQYLGHWRPDWACSGCDSDPAGPGSANQAQNFRQILTEATPVGRPLPKPGQANPVHILPVKASFL